MTCSRSAPGDHPEGMHLHSFGSYQGYGGAVRGHAVHREANPRYHYYAFLLVELDHGLCCREAGHRDPEG